MNHYILNTMQQNLKLTVNKFLVNNKHIDIK